MNTLGSDEHGPAECPVHEPPLALLGPKSIALKAAVGELLVPRQTRYAELVS